jgi:hypothetical protein
METQIFQHAKKYNLQKKNPLKETKKNPSRYYNSIINQSQVSTQAKISCFTNSSYKNRPIIIIIITRGQNPLSSTILYNDSKHNILALVGKANKSHDKTTAKLYEIFSLSLSLISRVIFNCHLLELK